MILVLAGTSDARALARKINGAGYELLTTVVTDNAAMELKAAGLAVKIGRLTSSEMASLIVEQGIHAVVDGSHPFAEEASRNAIQAAEQAGVPYIRYERESQDYQYEKLTVVESYVEAANLAAEKKESFCLQLGVKRYRFLLKNYYPIQMCVCSRGCCPVWIILKNVNH